MPYAVPLIAQSRAQLMTANSRIKMMTPEKFDNELLINLVKTRPLLWDKSLDTHKDLNQRSAAWRDICKILCPEYEIMARKEKHLYAQSVIKKWTNIRDAWRKSMIETKTRNKTKPYLYHDYLRFLEKNLYHVKESFLDEEDSRSKTSGVELEEGVMLERTDPYITVDSDDTSEHYSGMVHLEDDSLRARKRRIGEGEINGTESNIQVMEVKSLNRQTEDSPHVCFIRGLLPTLNKLNEDEVLDFQAGVIQLLQSIRKKGTPCFSDIVPNYGLASSSIDLNQLKGDNDDN